MGQLSAPPSPVIGDDVYIHLVVALSILGQVANGFAVGLLVAVDPVEPHLLLLRLLLQQRRLQGGLRVGDQPVRENGRHKSSSSTNRTYHSPTSGLFHTRGKLHRAPYVRVYTCLKTERLKHARINSDALNIDTTGCDSLGLDEDVCVGGVQHKFTDKLLRDGDGSLVGHAEIREIIQESGRVKTDMNQHIKPNVSHTQKIQHRNTRADCSHESRSALPSACSIL